MRFNGQDQPQYDSQSADMLDNNIWPCTDGSGTFVPHAKGVAILGCMEDIPLDGAIIRPYVDLNLETLYNVRIIHDFSFRP